MINYNNPYNQYPYTNYQQPSYSNGYNQFQQTAQPQQQTTYLPLTFVNGVEGAKAFIVGANQTVYLKDSDSDMLYEKRADAQGRYSIKAYKLQEMEFGKPKNEPSYVTMDLFNKTIEELKAHLGGTNDEPIDK